jgi:hypothetical protein
MVLDVGGSASGQSYSFNAASLFHQVGRSEGTAWSANVAQDWPAFMIYGPYTTALASGGYVATYHLLVDNNTANSDIVATIDAYDADAGIVLASRSIRRTAFAQRFTYQSFGLSFTATAGHRMEFRTYYHDRAYIRQSKVDVVPTSTSAWDNYYVTQGSVWQHLGTYYLVYEGTQLNGKPNVGLATSRDGVNFVRAFSGPLLQHGSGFESGGIGTPSLHWENGVWYVFYHGFNGTRLFIGVASGTNLTPSALHRSSANPILASGGWNPGGSGRRSRLRKINDYYYMVFEGPTAKCGGAFECSDWNSGVARSLSLLSGWTA